MKHERYYRAGEAIVGAFVRGELAHVDPCYCAVGRIVAAAHPGKSVSGWTYIVHSPNQNDPEGLLVVAPTNYSPHELAKVEDAFEGFFPHIRSHHDPDSFLGATAALETLHSLETWDERPINTETLELAEEVA